MLELSIQVRNDARLDLTPVRLCTGSLPFYGIECFLKDGAVLVELFYRFR